MVLEKYVLTARLRRTVPLLLTRSPGEADHLTYLIFMEVFMYNNFLSKKSKKAISALLASALVISAAPISADAATTKIIGVGKSKTVSVSSSATVKNLSAAEKKIVKITKKGKKFTIKGLKPGKATFKIGKKAFTVKVGATAVAKKTFATSLTAGTNKNVSVTAAFGKGDTLTWKSNKTTVVKVSKASVKVAANKKAAVVKNTLKPVKAGTATITITSKNTGKKVAVKVTVKAAAPAATTQAPAATTTAPDTTTGPATTTTAPDTTTGPATTTTAPDTTTGPATTTTAPDTTTGPVSGGATTAPQPTETVSGGATTAPQPTETPSTPSVELAAVTASAVSTKKITFVFNQAVTASAITKDDVVVTETSSKDRKFVKEVTANSDNVNAIDLEFYDDLTSDKAYEITVNVEGKAYTLNYDYAVGVPAKIVAGAQTIPFNTKKAVQYAVYDANGVDITATTTVNFTSDRNISAAGELELNSTSKTAFVNITYTLANGTTIESGQFIVTGEAREAKTLSNYTVADTGSFNTYDATDYKQNTVVYLNAAGSSYLNAQFKDQFGEVVVPETAVANFTSQDTSIAVVDKTTGLITPLKAGSVAVKIEAVNGSTVQYSTTIQLTIAPASVVAAVKAEETALTIYPELDQKTVTTRVYTEDQYGTKGTSSLVASTASDLVTVTLADGVLTVTPTAKGIETKEGTATIKVAYGTGANEISTNIVVTLKKLGTVSSYKVDGVKTVLDINSSDTTSATNYHADRMTLSVNPVDANGGIAGNPEDFTYQVTTGSGVGVISGASISGEATLQLGIDYPVVDKNGEDAGYTTQLVQNETYNVTVKVGNLTVNSFTFQVVDTRKAPAVTVAKSAATISATSGAAIVNSAELAKVLQGAGILYTDATVTNIEFVSANTNVISATGAFTAGYNTAVPIVIKSVTVKDTNNDIFTVNLNETVELTVSSKTQSEIAAEQEAERAAAKADAKATALEKLAAITTLVANVTATNINDVADAKDARDAVNAFKTAGGTDAEIDELDNISKLTEIEAKIAENLAAKQAADTAIAADVELLVNAASKERATGTIDLSSVVKNGTTVTVAEASDEDGVLSITSNVVTVTVSDKSNKVATFTIEVSKKNGTTVTKTIKVVVNNDGDAYSSEVVQEQE